MTAAAEQLNRIVQLVAELTQRDREGHTPVSLQELAARFDVTLAQVERDIATLTLLSDDAEADWLLSLRVVLDGDGIRLSCGGPFRRPLRFTTDEMLAVSVGLATEDGGEQLAARLADAAPGDVAVEGVDAPLVDLVRDAIASRHCLDILYAGEREPTGSRRVIRPHQLATFAGHVFIAAWCESASDWRHFRLDRVIDAVRLDRVFVWHEDFQSIEAPADLFRGDAAADDVRVFFSPEIARWILERYAHAEQQPDGGATVTYRVADVDWFVRRILQYGPEAEVLEPAEYREAMRQAVIES